MEDARLNEIRTRKHPSVKGAIEINTMANHIEYEFMMAKELDIFFACCTCHGNLVEEHNVVPKGRAKKLDMPGYLLCSY